MAIPILQARESLSLIRAFIHPNTKPESQKKSIRELERIANPVFETNETKAITTKDLFELTKRAMNARRR